MKIIPNENFKFTDFKNIDISNYKLDKNYYNIFIGISGYESRSIHFIKKEILKENKYDNHYIFCFTELEKFLSRENNDKYFLTITDQLRTFNTDNYQDLITDISSYLTDIVNSVGNKRLNIHLDISSMPRMFYCQLPLDIQELLRNNDKFSIIYSYGKYKAQYFQTEGISNFRLFSGLMSLNPAERTHLIGLGFDSLRTEGIVDIFDPKFLVTYYTDPGATQKYTDSVLKKNHETLNNSNMSFSVPFDNMEKSLIKLIGITKELSELCDLCIIPDGPKNLIFLSSMLPLIFDRRGIVCFHVSPNRSSNIPPSDTNALGPIIGACFTI